VSDFVPAIVLGGTGYVAGELLRLLAAHPRLKLAAVVSDSKPGALVAEAFPHLARAYPETRFARADAAEELVTRSPHCALFGAAPHGTAATAVERLLAAAGKAGTDLRVVDISADFRFADPERYQAVYGHRHPAPARLKDFTCALPEHVHSLTTPHVAHPGCFASAILLALVPLMKLELIEPELFVAGVTGSTGSGRTPSVTTHHPLRHSDLYSYSALKHRHAPEVVAVAESLLGLAPTLHFVAHSGPFARGIHVTAQARLKRAISEPELLSRLSQFYAGQPFVEVRAEPPRVKDVVGSNYARVGAAVDGNSVALMVVLDNLTKGAAGGAIQWMNRLRGWDSTLGLTAPAAGWT
jgi:N-acetyl-gamma-glutamyl-phosphate reductase common form